MCLFELESLILSNSGIHGVSASDRNVKVDQAIDGPVTRTYIRMLISFPIILIARSVA